MRAKLGIGHVLFTSGKCIPMMVCAMPSVMARDEFGFTTRIRTFLLKKRTSIVKSW